MTESANFDHIKLTNNNFIRWPLNAIEECARLKKVWDKPRLYKIILN